MCKKVFLFLFLGFWLLVVAKLYPEQWYRISETEVQNLEALSQKSEADRQSWQSQASELKMKAQGLQATSKTLNQQLLTEREKTNSLQKSFSQFVQDQYRQASNYETRIKNAEIKLLKTKRQRDIAFIILGFLFIIGMISIVFKLRRFGFPIAKFP